MSDTGNNRIQVFDPFGEYLYGFGSFGSAEGEFFNPIGLVIDSNGRIIIADEGNNRIQVFDPNGEFLLAFGSFGSEDGQFGSSLRVGVGIDDQIFVSSDDRVQVFDPNGEFLFTFGTTGSNNGEFNGARTVAQDDIGHIYVLDSGNGRVQVFDANGEFLTTFGQMGTNPGELSTTCNGLTLSRFGTQDGVRVIVADTGNDRVQIFEVNYNQ